MLMLSLSVLLCAVGLALMPILTDLWLLIFIVTITGIIAGYIDAAIQCIMLKVWGSKKSASILQLHHFTFSIGAFLAPLLGDTTNRFFAFSTKLFMNNIGFCSFPFLQWRR
jgi:fucose permease